MADRPAAENAPRDTCFAKLSSAILVGQPTRAFGELRMKASIRSVLSTKETSYSKASSKVEKQAAQDFGMLYVGQNMLERLLAYADASYEPEVQPPPYRLTDVPQRAIPVLSSEEALDAMVGMYREEMAIRQNTPPPLSTAESISDAVGSQIFPVMNYAIKTKEPNTINERNLPTGNKVVTKEERAEKPEKPSQWRSFFSDLHTGQPLEIEEVRKHYFCPHWARPAPGHLSGETGAAGRSDYALITSPGNDTGGTTASSGDIKPPWVYETSDIWGVFQGLSAFVTPEKPHAFQQDELQYRAESNLAIHHLLLILYGQAKGLRTTIGFFTNMDIVVFYCYYDGKRNVRFQGLQDQATLDVPVATLTRARTPRTQPVVQGGPAVQSGLVLSWPIPFTHPMALRCLQGMTFLALDVHANRWGGKGALDIVAPGDELVQIVPAMDIPATGVGLIAPIPPPKPASRQSQRDNRQEDGPRDNERRADEPQDDDEVDNLGRRNNFPGRVSGVRFTDMN